MQLFGAALLPLSQHQHTTLFFPKPRVCYDALLWSLLLIPPRNPSCCGPQTRCRLSALSACVPSAGAHSHPPGLPNINTVVGGDLERLSFIHMFWSSEHGQILGKPLEVAWQFQEFVWGFFFSPIWTEMNHISWFFFVCVFVSFFRDSNQSGLDVMFVTFNFQCVVKTYDLIADQIIWSFYSGRSRNCLHSWDHNSDAVMSWKNRQLA